MKPSKYQQSIWDFIVNDERNLLVNAVAGSGKTTTIVESLKLIKPELKSGFLAFNKSITEELRKRIPESIDVRTFHSLGMSSLKNRFPRTKVNEKKSINIIFSLLKKHKVEKEKTGSFVYKLSRIFDLIRLYDIDINNEEQLDSICEKYEILLFEVEKKALLDLYKISNSTIDKEIDFVDMIYQPIKLKLELPKYDLLFIDEAQDLSTIQHKLFLNSLKRNGRFICVGDPMQSIYGFAGADTESFNKISTYNDVVQLPLSVCYRCGENIIKTVKGIVPEIEPFENNGKGEVTEGTVELIKEGDMVISRNNKILVELCLRFFSENKKAFINGRDFGGELIQLIKDCYHKNLIVCSTRLKSELTKVVQNLHNRGVEFPEKTSFYKSVFEKVDIITNVIFKEVKNTDDAISLIKDLFKEKSNEKRILLSTIHKAKGLESDNVFVAVPEQIGSFKNCREEWEKQQETNLKYVCYTRAKKKLVFLIDTN